VADFNLFILGVSPPSQSAAMVRDRFRVTADRVRVSATVSSAFNKYSFVI